MTCRRQRDKGVPTPPRQLGWRYRLQRPRVTTWLAVGILVTLAFGSPSLIDRRTMGGRQTPLVAEPCARRSHEAGSGRTQRGRSGDTRQPTLERPRREFAYPRGACVDAAQEGVTRGAGHRGLRAARETRIGAPHGGGGADRQKERKWRALSHSDAARVRRGAVARQCRRGVRGMGGAPASAAAGPAGSRLPGAAVGQWDHALDVSTVNHGGTRRGAGHRARPAVPSLGSRGVALSVFRRGIIGSSGGGVSLSSAACAAKLHSQPAGGNVLLLPRAPALGCTLLDIMCGGIFIEGGGVSSGGGGVLMPPAACTTTLHSQPGAGIVLLLPRALALWLHAAQHHVGGNLHRREGAS